MFKIDKKHNGIWEWHDVLKDPESILLSVKESEWEYYTNKGGGETIIGRSALVKEETELHSRIMDIFFRCIREYCMGNGLSFTDENVGQGHIRIREYNTGSKMYEHSDIYSYVKKNGQSVRPSLTAILYINEDYVGGEINFVHDNLCITPKAGSVVVFPSNKQHEVLEIKSGDRYMTQTYVYEDPALSYDKPGQ